MEIQPESYPETIEGSEFPFGDVAKDDRFTSALHWLAECEGPEYRQEKERELTKKIRQNSPWIDAVSPNAKGTFADASKLCGKWDEDEDKTYARIGFWLAHSLNAQTNLLPTDYDDFTEEFEAIQAQGKEYSRVFGAAAWQCMERSHPNVLEIYTRLDKLLSETQLLTNDEQELQKAGMGLAYLLSVHSVLLRSEFEVQP